MTTNRAIAWSAAREAERKPPSGASIFALFINAIEILRKEGVAYNRHCVYPLLWSDKSNEMPEAIKKEG